jgi:hypothetical protein
MGQGIWRKHEIGGDCLWPVTCIHKGYEPVMMKVVDWDCIMGPRASFSAGDPLLRWSFIQRG